MSNLEDKIKLDKLVNQWTVLGDEKKTEEQLSLMCEGVNYQVYMGNQKISETVGRENLLKEFKVHVAQVNRYFSLDGQHIVNFIDQGATGILYSQMKMIRTDDEGNEILTDYSVRYDDLYIRDGENWKINRRLAHFIIVDSKTLISQ